MTDKSAPHFTTPAEAARTARLDREAVALRENLRRRKMQGRARAEGETIAPANKPNAGSDQPKAALANNCVSTPAKLPFKTKA